MSLNRGAPPASQPTATIPSAEEETHARVYEAPSPASSGTPPYTVPGGPQYSQPGQYQPSTAAYGVTSNTALIALILGIASFFGLSILGAIPAIILGRNARVEIQASGGRLTGEGMAQAGVVLGWINVALSVLGICFFCVFPILLGIGTSVSP